MTRHPPPTETPRATSLQSIEAKLDTILALLRHGGEGGPAQPDLRLRREGRMPLFWSDREVCLHVEKCHEDGVTTQQCIDQARTRFGPKRAPSKSAVHRYWQRLERQRGER